MQVVLKSTSLLLSLAIANFAAAQGELKSGIDPFSAKPKASDHAESSDFNSAHEKSTKKSLLPSFAWKSSKSPSKPTLFQKMARDSRIAMKKSQYVLMPWTKPKQTSLPITGLRPKPEEKKKLSLANLFKPVEEPKKIDSVNDWFRQPRPGFDE